MDQDYKVLAQFPPDATTLTALYTVPAETQAVISTIVIANRSNSVVSSYRIAIVPFGEELTTEHYIAYNVPIPASDSATLTLGLTMGAGDVLSVYTSTANLTFNIFGVEFS